MKRFLVAWVVVGVAAVAKADCEADLAWFVPTWVSGTADGDLVDQAVEPDQLVAELDGSVSLRWETSGDTVGLSFEAAP